MKIAGCECSIEHAYDQLVADESLLTTLEATAEERTSLVVYVTLRSHHTYLNSLNDARGRR